MSVQNTLLFFAVLLSGLIAGLFYSYSCSVNSGLGKLQNLEYLRAMQSINVAILNPVFFLSFLGTLLVLPATAWVSYTQNPSMSFYLLLAASIIYVVGVFAITLAGNVPLNESLATFDLTKASPTELLKMRKSFELTWNRYHSIRAVASVISFALTILSLVKVK